MNTSSNRSRRRFIKLLGLTAASLTWGGLYWWRQLPTVNEAIVIDPGHGGFDPGVVVQGLREADVALEISLLLYDQLRAKGLPVLLTRSEDQHLNRDKLQDLAARSAFTRQHCQLFISVHANAAEPSSVQGIETYIFGRASQGLNHETAQAHAQRENGASPWWPTNDPRQSLTARSVQASECVQRQLIRATGARDRGVRRNVFYVLRQSQAPAMLVETGFLTNAEERRLLANSSYRSLIAAAIADGVEEYLELQAAAQTDS